MRNGDRMDVRVDVRVDRALCEANGRCVTVAPEMFSLDDDEILHIAPPPAGIGRARMEQAVAACPLSALSLHEDPVPAPDA
jgi:ferredoxin